MDEDATRTAVPALRQDLQGQRDDTLPALRREDQMKVKLAWRIGLTPFALIILPLYIIGYAWIGMLEWVVALVKFWYGDYDDQEAA